MRTIQKIVLQCGYRSMAGLFGSMMHKCEIYQNLRRRASCAHMVPDSSFLYQDYVVHDMLWALLAALGNIWCAAVEKSEQKPAHVNALIHTILYLSWCL